MVSGKVVFITGAASGVGLHLVNRFVAEGYKVVATDINFQALKLALSDNHWPKDNVLIRKLDITKTESWRSVWEAVETRWGGVDVLLNVAGYLKPGFVHEIDQKEVDRHIDINVKGLIYGSQLAASKMVASGKGHIINIASLAGVAAIPGIGLYSASKFAVRGFSLALAQEVKSHGVDVTVICPDAIDTPMLSLQEDYEEAALTFSGSKVLTVEMIGDLVLEKVLKNKPMEITIPPSRGIVAKMGGVIPQVSYVLGNYLTSLGKKRQQLRKGLRRARV